VTYLELSGVAAPNKRIKLARRSAGGLRGGRRARSLSAVRWAEQVEAFQVID
jgi:hypothetical protein